MRRRFHVERAGGHWWVIRDRQRRVKAIVFRYRSRALALEVSDALNGAQLVRERQERDRAA